MCIQRACLRSLLAMVESHCLKTCLGPLWRSGTGEVTLGMGPWFRTVQWNLGGRGAAGNPDTEASQWALYPTSKGGASSYSVAQGFSKGGTWTTDISISSRNFNTNADSWAPPQMESESLRAGLKKVYILNKLFRRSWCKFENPCWRRTTVCTWSPLSTPASPAKARTWNRDGEIAPSGG